MLRRTHNGGRTPPRLARANLKGAPLWISPQLVARVLDEKAHNSRVVEVPLLPIRLVDRPRRSEDPRLAQANDDGLFVPETYSDEPEETPEHAWPLTGDPLDWPDAPAPQPDPDVNDLAGGQMEAAPEAATLPAAPTLRAMAAPTRKRDGLYRSARDQAARELEAPVDHATECKAMIRDAAARLAARKSAPRIVAGAPAPRAPIAIPAMPHEARRAQLAAAIAFLKARCILVFPADREAMIRTYRVSGKAAAMLAEDVIAHARGMGFAG